MNYHNILTRPKNTESKRSFEVKEIIFKGVETAFSELQANRWIDEVRKASPDAALDIDATSVMLGIDTYWSMPSNRGSNPESSTARGCILGIDRTRNRYPVSVHLNPTYDSLDNRFTFGHEVGHYFLDLQGLDQSSWATHVESLSIESFCEYFATQLAVPIDMLKGYEINDLPFLVEAFGVGPQPIIYQLMLLGKLPRKIYFDTRSHISSQRAFKEKVHRDTICLDCALGRRCSWPSDMPILDLTSFEWADLIMGSRCGPSTQKLNEGGLRFYEEINRLYGEWTDSDEDELRRVYRQVNKENPYAFIHMDPSDLVRLGLSKNLHT